MAVFHASLASSSSRVEGRHLLDPIVWKKPSDGVIKANWDVAIDTLNNRMGVGVILRDAHGTVVASMSSLVPFVNDPTTAEGVALWRVVVLSVDLEVSRLQLEGDSQEIVQAMLQKGPCWTRYGYLIEESRSRLTGL